jgi:hypothetical protein
MAEPTKTTKRAWNFDYGEMKVNCYVSDDDTCHACNLLTAGTLSSFHDETLAGATRKIRHILDRVKHSATLEEHQHLCFIRTHKGLFLVRSEESLGTQDSDAEINSVLGITEE